ncbi:disease resistance protein RPS5-like [Gossypium arboreum]|uniref:disease resistance protein RPS5-like n=1 Tax=Gossypium arboreum TaxID=29729 RepID=UPI00081958F0|nr:disease resistance protein RPS5-like [Gossypium arboreum]
MDWTGFVDNNFMMSIAKLQKDMASKIGVSFCGDEDEITRAGMLFEALSRKRRSMIILDDLWQEVSLDKVGIPKPSTGSKLVLTTRSFDVCRKMSCRAIKVKPWVEEESWKLFPEKMGRGILNIPEVELIAKKIVERYADLPLGVITVASCMKDIDDLCEWRNALKELSDRKKSVNGLEEEVFHCALYPEDWEIEERELVRLWIAEGLVEDMDSRQVEFDRGRAIMNRLLNKCMGLREPPNVQEWSEDLEKVSLMRNWEFEVLYPLEMSPPKCPMLTTLLLSGSSIEYSGRFLQPYGWTQEYVPSLSNLRALKELDLEGTAIKEVPHGMQNLSSLKCLKLGYRNVDEIPNGIFPRPSCLQELNVGKAFISGKESHVNTSSLWVKEDGQWNFLHQKRLYYGLVSVGVLTPEELGLQLHPHDLGSMVCSLAAYAPEVSYCGQLEEIIASEERGRVTMEFCFPRLKEMSLKYLPELKSICSVDAVMICESLERLDVMSCPKLKRMRFKLPQVEPSSPLELAISLEAMELFESIELAHPDFKFKLL